MWQPRPSLAPKTRNTKRRHPCRGRGVHRKKSAQARFQTRRAMRLPSEKLGPVNASGSFAGTLVCSLQKVGQPGGGAVDLKARFETAPGAPPDVAWQFKESFQKPVGSRLIVRVD